MNCVNRPLVSLRLQINCLLENYKLNCLNKSPSDDAQEKKKNEIMQNTTALMDFVNINTAWLIDLL